MDSITNAVHFLVLAYIYSRIKTPQLMESKALGIIELERHLELYIS